MRDTSNIAFEKGEQLFAGSRKKGALIVYEGISGCGKSESIKKNSQYLADNGYPVKVVEWNSNRTIRMLTGWINSRGMLTSGLYSFLQWLSFFLDYIRKVRPYLKKGYIVIADRYIYTGLTRDKVNCSKQKSSHWIIRLVRKPDMLLFFDTHPQICYERVMLRGKPLFHTNKKIHRSSLLKNKELYYLKKLRNEYLKLIADPVIIKNTNVLVINDNFEMLNQKLYSYLKLKFGILIKK
jgi:dTMP kinase